MNKYDDTDYLIEREESIEHEEGSDINVASIEKDIKRCEELTKPEHANWIGISNQLAIAHVVDRVKEVENDLTTVYLKGYADAEEKYKARIKEVESKLKESNKQLDLDYVDKNYIPVEKVNDEIEKYEYMLAETIHGEIQKYTPGEILLKIDTLKEILEDK